MVIRSVLIALLLSGCAAFDTPPVRIANVPSPPVIERPILESDSITEEMSVDELVQAFRISIIKLKDYAKKLETNLNVYRR